MNTLTAEIEETLRTLEELKAKHADTLTQCDVIDYITDVQSELQGQLESETESLIFTGHITAPKSDYEQHNTLNHAQQGIK